LGEREALRVGLKLPKRKKWQFFFLSLSSSG
jgi:hypothetical protein